MNMISKTLVGLAAAVILVSAPASAQNVDAAGSVAFGAIEPGAEALKVALALNKGRIFRLQRDARDVLVSNPDIADVVMKTPRLVYVFGQEIGETNVFFFDGDGEEIVQLDITVDRDLTSLRTVLADLLPNTDVEVYAVNQNIVLRGPVRSAQAAEDVRRIARRFVAEDDEIISMLSIGGDQQVMLRVRVAEMTRTMVKELGVNLTFTDNGRGRLQTSGQIGNGAGSNAFGAGIGVVGIVDAFTALSAVIDALDRQGLIKTLAEPNLTAVSGENANFLVGGEFPVPIPQDEDTVVIEWREFGVLLTFTPVVLNSGMISLKISTEVSQLSTDGQVTISGFVIPALTVARAETTVELPSGGSFVIAGLLQNDITNTIEGFPGLKDIPVLGALFRSVAFSKQETELVITVTPYLVRAISENDVVLPTDGFAPASDFDMIFLGRLHDVYRKPETTKVAAKPLQGPIGYIME